MTPGALRRWHGGTRMYLAPLSCFSDTPNSQVFAQYPGNGSFNFESQSNNIVGILEQQIQRREAQGVAANVGKRDLGLSDGEAPGNDGPSGHGAENPGGDDEFPDYRDRSNSPENENGDDRSNGDHHDAHMHAHKQPVFNDQRNRSDSHDNHSLNRSNYHAHSYSSDKTPDNGSDHRRKAAERDENQPPMPVAKRPRIAGPATSNGRKGNPRGKGQKGNRA
jgi:hypothetical protein